MKVSRVVTVEMSRDDVIEAIRSAVDRILSSEEGITLSGEEYDTAQVEIFSERFGEAAGISYAVVTITTDQEERNDA